MRKLRNPGISFFGLILSEEPLYSVTLMQASEFKNQVGKSLLT
jgi:hypothetical protein